MKKKTMKISIAIFTVLSLSNIFSGYINIFTEGLFDTYLYQTENAEFEFTTMPGKGRNIKTMERQFANFKENNPKFRDLKLYRTFYRNPLKFWKWHSYFVLERYKYDFMNKVDSKIR